MLTKNRIFPMELVFKARHRNTISYPSSCLNLQARCSVTGSIGNDNNNESTRTQLNTTTTSIIHTRMTKVQHACINHYMVKSHNYIIHTCHYIKTHDSESQGQEEAAVRDK